MATLMVGKAISKWVDYTVGHSLSVERRDSDRAEDCDAIKTFATTDSARRFKGRRIER